MQVVAAAMLALSGMAQAALIDRANGTVYDSINNITWLKDWAVTSNSGPIDWATATSWAEGLTFAGSSDWVLPSLSQFQDLAATVPANDLTNSNLPFSNVQNNPRYWTGTEFSTGFKDVYLPGANGWGPENMSSSYAAVAIHIGDVAVVPVPEPETYVMLLAGLGALSLVKRRRAC